MPENKGLNRGGTLGQEGELSPEGGTPPQPETGRPKGSVKDRLDWRDQQKQRGGIGREPNLEDKERKDQDLEEKHDIQPKHQVD